MAIEVIETLIDGTTFYELPYSLDGEDFILRFEWNSQDEHWFFSLYTAAGEIVPGCSSVRLVKGIFPLWRVRNELRPQGEFVVISDTEEDPGLRTLGTLSSLMYIPKAEVDASR